MDASRTEPDPSNDEQRARVRASFDALADSYDEVDVPFAAPIAAGLVRELRPRPGERALDVGCGRGAALFPLVDAVGATGHVTGTDLSPAMVELTAADIEAAGLADVADVRVGDAQDRDLPADTVDIVAASLVLFFVPDPAAALASWRVPLVVGGRMGISTFGPYNDEWSAVDRVFEPYLPPGSIQTPTRVGGPFATDAGVERLVADAGYHDVRTVTSTLPVRFTDVAQWEAWTWSTGQRRMWEAVPADERGAVRALAAERLDRCRDAQGRIGFDQGVRYTLATN